MAAGILALCLVSRKIIIPDQQLASFFSRTMSLAEASEARKGRLLALRRRKAGEETPNDSYVLKRPSFGFPAYKLNANFRDEPVIKNRNFDPATRTLRKHDQTEDAMMEDTVEKNVDGLAENIIAEDEERRAQELVRHSPNLAVPFLTAICAPQDIFNIAPKRPNWDLKREMQKKLAKLERKTQESIHTLIRE
jgi:coiled-coil domain-containing protein 12